jgi:hypothetical protein
LGVGRILVYFDQKIGGEISVSGTPRSLEMAFDVTLVELVGGRGQLAMAAVRNLRSPSDGLRRLLRKGRQQTSKCSRALPEPLPHDSPGESNPSVLAHLALRAAPQAASEQLLSSRGIYSTLRRRIDTYWPDELADEPGRAV